MYQWYFFAIFQSNSFNSSYLKQSLNGTGYLFRKSITRSFQDHTKFPLIYQLTKCDTLVPARKAFKAVVLSFAVCLKDHLLSNSPKIPPGCQAEEARSPWSGTRRWTGRAIDKVAEWRVFKKKMTIIFIADGSPA